jgi:hypothetical protein
LFYPPFLHAKNLSVNDSTPSTGRVSLSWPRRQWLKFVALLEDHPLPTVTLIVLTTAFLLFYATRLHGWSHFKESFARWRVDAVGGTHKVNRSIRIPDVLLSFEDPEHDRIDFLAPTSVHIGANAFRQELQELVDHHGAARIITLDPRLADPSHPHHERFSQLARAFGQEPWEFAARALYNAAVVMRLDEEFGDACRIRFVSTPSPDARPPYFTIGRSGHSYQSDNPDDRLDVMVPRPETPTGRDSLTDPATIAANRPNHPDVTRFTNAFDNTWETAAPLDDAIRAFVLLNASSYDPKTPGHQP